jgi:primosomal protein N' (replication factor Y)
MNLVQVIPLRRGIAKENLTYFSSQNIPPGAIVTIPLRGRSSFGLVTSTTPAKADRAKLRQSSHALKKVSGVTKTQFLLPAFLAAARTLADYQAAPLGSVLAALIPQTILNQAARLKMPPANTEGATTDPFQADIAVLQDSDEERLVYYKSRIREEFARQASIILCLPTGGDIKRFIASLGRGIEEYTFPFHGKLTAAELRQNWNDLLTTAHPVLAVITPSFFCLPRFDVRTIIVDREGSSAYKSNRRPFVDYRRLAEALARESSAKLVFGDLCPRSETVAKVLAGDWAAINSPKQRSLSRAESLLLETKSGEVMTEEIIAFLAQAQERRERTFILANRRGLAPIVVCDDCGQTVLCGRCQSPVALHSGSRQGQDTNLLLCHRCGEERSARTKCANCGGWRLRELGSGIERVVADLEAARPGQTIFQIDSDSVTTPKRAAEIAGQFVSASGSVLVGTEMALHYLPEKIENSLVLATDSLLHLPDYRIHERLFGLLVRIRAESTRRFLVQTRYPEEPLFQFVLGGNLLEFYRQELAERQELNYPPYKLLIKVTLEGTRESCREGMKKLSQLLTDYEPTVYPAFHEFRRGQYRLNLLLRRPPASWPDETLVAVLKSLPPSFIVNVDPLDIL